MVFTCPDIYWSQFSCGNPCQTMGVYHIHATTAWLSGTMTSLKALIPIKWKDILRYPRQRKQNTSNAQYSKWRAGTKNNSPPQNRRVQFSKLSARQTVPCFVGTLSTFHVQPDIPTSEFPQEVKDWPHISNVYRTHIPLQPSKQLTLFAVYIMVQNVCS